MNTISRNRLVCQKKSSCRSRTWWHEASETDIAAFNLFVFFEGNVAANHVVEQNAKWPDSGGASVVAMLTDPFWWRVDPRTWAREEKNMLIRRHTHRIKFKFNRMTMPRPYGSRRCLICHYFARSISLWTKDCINHSTGYRPMYHKTLPR